MPPVSTKLTFALGSDEKSRKLPSKIVISQSQNETLDHVLLKALAFVIFHSDRLRLEVDLEMPGVPFVPDLVALALDGRPELWIECGEVSLHKLEKLTLKLGDADIWIVKKSAGDVAKTVELARPHAAVDVRSRLRSRTVRAGHRRQLASSCQTRAG
ncbi:MAG: YaeQ family protein [Verrucomicrobiia bacterium]